MFTSSRSGGHRALRTRAVASAAVGAVLGTGGLVGLAGPAQAASLPDNCTLSGVTATCSFAYSGASQDFTVPLDVESIQVEAWGGHGAMQSGQRTTAGRGAQVSATFAVQPGDALAVTVGGDANGPTGGFGYGHGGSSDNVGGGGGGGTAVVEGATVLLVAGAGGGVGSTARQCQGGGFGGDAGHDGGGGNQCGNTGWGAGGPAGGAPSNDGGDRRPGVVPLAGAGGGGGGYQGGLGGQGFGFMSATSCCTSSGGGGGGTSFADPSGADVSLSDLSDRALGTNGQVVITFVVPDGTPPQDAPVATPAANAAGWNDTDVSVAWHWTDAGIGVDPASCDQQSGSAGEGVQSLSATCADLAGNSATDSLQVKVDKTAPVSDPAVSTTSTGASVEWNWSDALSGVDAASCTQSSSQIGTGQLTLTSSCTDVAGNTATDSRTVTVSRPQTSADVQTRITGPESGRRNTAYTYFVTVQNAGPEAASQVTTALRLPTGARLVSASGSYQRVGPVVVWKAVPSLADHAKSTYKLKVMFPARGTTTMEASSASRWSEDPKPANNAAAVQTRIS
jgi:uncharacterized repeat protein (TIGR01451 family)